jgi:hypothetical protein
MQMPCDFIFAEVNDIDIYHLNSRFKALAGSWLAGMA